MKLDRIDRKILMLLQADSQMSLLKISEEVGLSATALHHRIKKLKKSGVIRRFTIQIDIRKSSRDLISFVSIVKNKNSTIEIAQKLKAIPQIESCHSVTGEVSLTVKIRFSDTVELQAILEKIHKISGVERTLTSLMIEEHFDRGIYFSQADNVE